MNRLTATYMTGGSSSTTTTQPSWTALAHRQMSVMCVHDGKKRGEEGRKGKKSFFAAGTGAREGGRFDTGFLGTPTDRDELLRRRPISPHLFPTTEGA